MSLGANRSVHRGIRSDKRGELFACGVDSLQEIDGHVQPRCGFCFLHEQFGNRDGMKDDALAGASYMWEQSMFDRIMLRAVRRVVCHTNLQLKPIGSVAAAAIAEQQQAACIGVERTPMPSPPVRNAVATKFAGIVAGVEM